MSRLESIVAGRLTGVKRPSVAERFGVVALVLAAVVFGAGSVGKADDISLSLPVACTPGENCWAVKHLDVADGPEAKDPKCGSVTTDNHNGTDIAVRSPAEVDRKFAVLAAAPGRVREVRDGMEDKGARRSDIPSLKKRECGNGVVIDHDDEWQTRYCHMRNGSIRVAAGQAVRRGEEIGFVGLSGLTAFPHLHFTVVRNRVYVDPFTGSGMRRGCGKDFGSLWDASVRARLRYQPTVILDVGFVGDRPDWTLRPNGYAKSGTLLRGNSIYLWADIFGTEAGDQVEFRFFSPKRRLVYSELKTVNKTKLRRVLLIKVPEPSAQRPLGLYTARVTHTRKGERGTDHTESGAVVEIK